MKKVFIIIGMMTALAVAHPHSFSKHSDLHHKVGVVVTKDDNVMEDRGESLEVPKGSGCVPDPVIDHGAQIHDYNKNIFTRNGIKAGLSGYPGINLYATDAMDAYAPYIGWYSDYMPNTTDYGNVQGIPMLWGDGDSCDSTTDNWQRMETFWNTVSWHAPPIMMGFYEPDCDCPMSSDMSDPVYGASKWNQMLAPLAPKGTKLGSPSMCKQSDEDWLTPFKAAGLHADWDVTSIHVNVYNLAGVQKDVEHYASLYGKPIWVSEFACVHAGDGFFNPCTDQAEIDNFINTVVPWLEANETVVAYGASNGEGLGTVWPLTNSKGQLSHTGYTYLNALKNLNK